MNIIALAIAGTLFIIGIYVGRTTITKNNTSEPTPTMTITPTPSEEITPTTDTTPFPTDKSSTPSPSKTPTPTQKISNGSTDSSLIYHGLSISSQTSSKIEGTTTDDPATVTSWYENQLMSQGYSSRSSSKTNTNGQVLNKVGGGKNDQTVMITISKKAEEKSTHVLIEFQSGTNGNVHIEIHNSN